jgi:chromosome segregation ATPase
MTAELAAARTEAAERSERLASREAEFADLDHRLTAVSGDLDAKRITVSDLETRLMTQTSRADDYERALGERRSELSDERLRLADLARDLAAEQERGLLLAQRIRELEAERAAERAEVASLVALRDVIAGERDAARTSLIERGAAIGAMETALQAAQTRIAAVEAREGSRGESHASDLRGLTDQIEILKAEKAASEGALMESREDRLRLEQTLQSMRKDSDGRDMRSENAELRQRITEVADLVMQDTKPKATRSGRRRNASR